MTSISSSGASNTKVLRDIRDFINELRNSARDSVEVQERIQEQLAFITGLPLGKGDE